MANNNFDKPHFFLDSSVITQKFITPSTGGSSKPSLTPAQNRLLHSKKLRHDLIAISEELIEIKADITDVPLKMGIGIQVEFESFPDTKLAVESLADAKHGIELYNIKTLIQDSQDKTIATVFIPEGKLHIFEKKITDYVNEKKTTKGKPKDNQKLIDSIQSIRTAVFSAIWSDEDSFLPINKNESIWWEIWLSTPKVKKEPTNKYREVLEDFTQIAAKQKIEVSTHQLRFPEHTIINIRASQEQLENNTFLLSRISEIRAPKATAEFFDSSSAEEQSGWSEELLSRLNFIDNGNVPYVCIIDSGVNYGHPLLSPFITADDQWTITNDQDPTDIHGHGTGMAGLAAWGDLSDVLSSNAIASISHKIESVKVINHNGDNKDRPQGTITLEAVSLAEVKKPFRQRTFSMSLSANTGTNRGRPSSWSSSLDALAIDVLGDSKNPRLFTICAGNAKINCFYPDRYPYPDFNQTQDIHDPAQAWNVISVGAYTNKTSISESCEYSPLAYAGGLSPHSTTSLIWDRKNSPIKPEVVFEGGNLGKGQYDYRDDIYDFDLLTTNNDFLQKHFKTSNATSAATALAARFTAQIRAEYPTMWPETIRALTIHSADWTDNMFRLINAKRTDKNIKKTSIVNLTRMVGFGVPNLIKAIKSANNSLSLVIQNEIQPFGKEGSDIKTKDMHLYDLPWPKDELLALGNTNVELTVTLSYFVEPNPSSRNILNKYSYASHQLRFDVKRPLESNFDFQKRINKANRESKQDKPNATDDSNWLIGTDGRHKGSIHKDIWRGNATELAERGKIAIYPATGWWKTRTSHERWNSKARYALIVSLSVPETNIDLYSIVKAKIEAKIKSDTKVMITN